MKTKKILSSGLHVLVWKEGTWFVAKCVGVDRASQGKNQEEALKNIEEAISLYFSHESLSIPSGLSGMELHQVTPRWAYV